MKLGARIIKTGIAIVISLYLASLITDEYAVVAGISALFAMQPSVNKSFQTVIDRTQGTFIGGLLAVFIVTAVGNHLIIIGFTSVILIALLAKINLSHVTGFAVVAQIIIMEHHGDDFLMTALIRVTTVLVGVISAAIVNMFFLPPKYDTKLYQQNFEISNDIFKWVRLSISGSTEFIVVKEDIEDIHKRIKSLDTLYDLFKNEKVYFKKHIHSNTRRIVLFKEMIKTTRRGYDLLRRIHVNENDMLHLPEELHVRLKFELDEILTVHEDLLMKITDKAHIATTADTHKVMSQFDTPLISAVLEELKSKEEQQYNKEHIIQVVGALFEYKEQIEYFDMIMNSFYTYHTEDEKVTIDVEEIKA